MGSRWLQHPGMEAALQEAMPFEKVLPVRAIPAPGFILAGI
jgi:hypothetical protein